MSSVYAPRIHGNHAYAATRNFGQKVVVLSDDAIDRDARIALFGTRNGKKPAVCPVCHLSLLTTGICGNC